MSQDLDQIMQAQSRADLELRRKMALGTFLASDPAPDEEFLREVDRIDYAVEGREDLTWTLEVYQRGRHYLENKQANPLMKAKLLEQFAGALGLRDQNVRAINVLQEALSLVPPKTLEFATVRSQVLKDLAGCLDKTGDAPQASRVLQEAASLDNAEPTAYTHSLATLAEHYARYFEIEKARSAMARLETYLKKSPPPPLDAQEDGWQRVVTFYSNHGFVQDALAGMRQLGQLKNGRILSELTSLYRDAGTTDPDQRVSVANQILVEAHNAAGEPGRISTLIELAGVEVEQRRLDGARHFLEQSDAARVAYDSQAHKQEKTEWRVRSDEVKNALARAARGDKFISARSLLRSLDEKGEPISSPEPPPLSPSQTVSRAFEQAVQGQPVHTEAEAIELLEKIAAQTPGATNDPRFREMVSAMKMQSAVSESPLIDEINRVDQKSAAEMDAESWMIVRRAIKEGQSDWVEKFLISRLGREADGFAHPFSIQELMHTLLDAFAERRAWDDGRHWLEWWRALIARIDHPESTRLLENFDAEIRWEERASQPARALGIRRSQIEFARKIMGDKNEEVLRLEQQLNSAHGILPYR